jgi:hypothetical protein
MPAASPGLQPVRLARWAAGWIVWALRAAGPPHAAALPTRNEHGPWPDEASDARPEFADTEATWKLPL